MARHIRYAIECWYCREMTLEGRGFLHRHQGRWYAHCFECYESKKSIKENSPTRGATGESPKEKTMKLELAILAGEESKAFLLSFAKQIDRLEALTKGTSKTAAAVDDDEETETDETDDDEDFKPKKKAATKAAAFDDDEEETETDEEEEKPAPKKSKKPKAPTIEQVNAACKEYASNNGVNATKTLLKKKFKTVSIKELEPDQYQAVIDLMKGE